MDIVVQASAARADDGASLAQELTAQAASLQQNIGELVLLIGGKTSQQSTPADILESETQVIPPAHVGKHQLPAATNR